MKNLLLVLFTCLYTTICIGQIGGGISNPLNSQGKNPKPDNIYTEEMCFHAVEFQYDNTTPGDGFCGLASGNFALNPNEIKIISFENSCDNFDGLAGQTITGANLNNWFDNFSSALTTATGDTWDWGFDSVNKCWRFEGTISGEDCYGILTLEYNGKVITVVPRRKYATCSLTKKVCEWKNKNGSITTEESYYTNDTTNGEDSLITDMVAWLKKCTGFNPALIDNIYENSADVISQLTTDCTYRGLKKIENPCTYNTALVCAGLTGEGISLTIYESICDGLYNADIFETSSLTLDPEFWVTYTGDFANCDGTPFEPMQDDCDKDIISVDWVQGCTSEGDKVRWLETVDGCKTLSVCDTIYNCGDGVDLYQFNEGCGTLGGSTSITGNVGGTPLAEWTVDGNTHNIEYLLSSSWLITNQLNSFVNSATPYILNLKGEINGVTVVQIWVDPTTGTVLNYDHQTTPYFINADISENSSGCTNLDNVRNSLPNIVPADGVYLVDRVFLGWNQVNGIQSIVPAQLNEIYQIGFDGVSCDCCDAVPTGTRKCAIVGKEKIDIEKWDRCGTVEWRNCQTNVVVEDIEFIDCECDYSIFRTRLCCNATGIEWEREIEVIVNCVDERRLETDFNVGGTTPITTVVCEDVDGNNTAYECSALNTPCETVCYLCSDPPPSIDPVKPIKIQITEIKQVLKARSISKKTVKKLEKDLQALERKVKQTVTFPKFNCKEGDQLQVKFCGGLIVEVDGEPATTVDTIGYDRLPSCEVEVCEVDQATKVVGLVSIDWSDILDTCFLTAPLVEGENIFLPTCVKEVKAGYNWLDDTNIDCDPNNPLLTGGLYTDFIGSLAGAHLYYDFSQIPECAIINSMKITHTGSGGSGNVYSAYKPSTGTRYDLIVNGVASVPDRVWHHPGSTCNTTGTYTETEGVGFPCGTARPSNTLFESIVDIDGMTGADLQDFALRFTALNEGTDVVGATNIILDYSIPIGCELLDENGNPISTENETYLKVGIDASCSDTLFVYSIPAPTNPQPITQSNWALKCDDTNNDGIGDILYYDLVEITYVDGIQIGIDITQFESDFATPYTPIAGDAPCEDGLTPPTNDILLCDYGTEPPTKFIRRSTTINTTNVVVTDLELDLVTMYTAIGNIDTCPEETATLKDCGYCCTYRLGRYQQFTNLSAGSANGNTWVEFEQELHNFGYTVTYNNVWLSGGFLAQDVTDVEICGASDMSSLQFAFLGNTTTQSANTCVEQKAELTQVKTETRKPLCFTSGADYYYGFLVIKNDERYAESVFGDRFNLNSITIDYKCCNE